MGAIIGVGLTALFGLMGAAALVTWIDSYTKNNPIKSGLPSTEKPNEKPNSSMWDISNEKLKNMTAEQLNEQIKNIENSWMMNEQEKKEAIQELQMNWEQAQLYQDITIPDNMKGVDWNNPEEANDAINDRWVIDPIQENPYTNITDVPGESGTIGEVKPGEGEGTGDGIVSGEGDEGKVVEGIVSGEGKVDGVIAGESGKPTGSGGAVVVPESEIKDGTNDGLEEFIDGIDMQSVLDLIDKNHREQRAYEEKIRKETQEREDNAYSRAVADLRRSGINPNLVNLVQSASGGGIVQPTPKDYTLWQTEINKTLSMIQQQIELNFKGEQADKDRLVKAITSIMGLVAIGARMK